MDLWRVIDFTVVGWIPVSIEGSFPLEEARRRIAALNSGPESAAIPLTTTVVGDRVEACYLILPESAAATSPGHSSLLHFIRPVFRGRLAQGSPVLLNGAFGAGWIVRFLGLIATTIVVFMALGSVAPSLARIGYWFWGVPLIFVGACIVARINCADDVRLIVNNLYFAMRGDD